MKTRDKTIHQIKMILFDVDGVLTTGDIIYGSNNLEIKTFNIQDGMGITLAKKAGLLVGAITGRTSEAVSRRLTELGFDDIIQDCPKKIVGYNALKEKWNLNDNEIAYVGDDVLDLPVLRMVGLPIAVRNSVKEVKKVAKHVSSKTGGSGAVREIIDWILKKQKKHGDAIRIALETIVNKS